MSPLPAFFPYVEPADYRLLTAASILAQAPGFLPVIRRFRKIVAGLS